MSAPRRRRAPSAADRARVYVPIRPYEQIGRLARKRFALSAGAT